MGEETVKKRKKVSIDESEIQKKEYKRETSKGIQIRYAFRAKDDDDTNLTKFLMNLRPMWFSIFLPLRMDL